MEKKNIIIVSNNTNIYDALCDTVDTHDLQLVKNTSDKFLNSEDKISILIIDSEVAINFVPEYKINIVVNTTSLKISKNEIRLAKPFSLNDLLLLIEKDHHDQSIFCLIDDGWIYNQKSAKISAKDRSILFTDKENILFARMLLTNNNWLDKDVLLRQVWNYHESSESSTVGTHLYNLKQKLPQGMMELSNSSCRLLIKKMVNPCNKST